MVSTNRGKYFNMLLALIFTQCAYVDVLCRLSFKKVNFIRRKGVIEHTQAEYRIGYSRIYEFLDGSC